MGSGLFGKAALAANIYTGVATAEAVSTVNIRLVNRDVAVGVAVRLAVVPAGWIPGAAPDSADYIEPVDLAVPPAGVLEETGMVLSAGETVVAWASTGAVTVRVFGFE